MEDPIFGVRQLGRKASRGTLFFRLPPSTGLNPGFFIVDVIGVFLLRLAFAASHQFSLFV
jgi:hypothetical protein